VPAPNPHADTAGSPGELIVVALGGNAIAREEDDGSIAAQRVRAEEAAAVVADLICSGHRVVVTHGNGPVVGNIMLRGELACETVAPTPLYIADADSEGGIGLLLQLALSNELRRRGEDRCVVSLVTQVVVAADDPAFGCPTKPIGPHYARDRADALAREHGWQLTEQPDGRWRRVVASPRPLRVVEVGAVSALVEAGVVPIAAGGGGVPMTTGPGGELEPVDAVIDKDWSSAVLAHSLGADLLVILMEAAAVYRGWGTTDAEPLSQLDSGQAQVLAEHSDPGGIAPKLAASAWFARLGGRSVICRPEDLMSALHGEAGTTIVDAV
jgi:carbamate kinase